MPRMKALPTSSTLDRNLPMLKRNAIVRIRIENAQGLMLSMSAAATTSGRSHLPSSDQFQSAVVPIFPALNKITDPTSSTQIPTSSESFLFMTAQGVTMALKRSTKGGPASFIIVTVLSVWPIPAGPCAAGSNTTSTRAVSPGAKRSLSSGTGPCPGIPNGPLFPAGVISVAVVHMQEVDILVMVSAAPLIFLIEYGCDTLPAAIEIFPKSKNGDAEESARSLLSCPATGRLS